MTAIHPCPTCGARLEFELVMAGQTIACPECQALVTLPELPPSPAPEPAKPPTMPAPVAPARPAQNNEALGCLGAAAWVAGIGWVVLLFISIPSCVVGGALGLFPLLLAVLLFIAHLLCLGFYAVAKSASRR